MEYRTQDMAEGPSWRNVEHFDNVPDQELRQHAGVWVVQCSTDARD